jgi:phage replication O-like protein O
MSPQKENGYTPIANELLEAFCKCKLLEYERCLVMTIWRKTYGWSKKEDWVSNSQLSESTGIARPNITRTLNSLKEKNIISKNGKKVSVNKNYNEWKVEWRKVISPDNRVISPDNKKLSHQIPTKASKANILKSGDKSPHKEIMSFNKKGEDYEEGVIDMDGDNTLIEEKKPQTKKYPNAPAIRKIFLTETGKCPANWKINKTQLQACENLYTEQTPRVVQNALRWHKEHKDIEFCPQITSPYDLDSKWTKLNLFKKKYGN